MLKSIKNLTFFILFFHLTAAQLFSQQCGYDNYYLFALRVTEQAGTTKVDNLKMYLVDEEERPILAAGTYLENQQWIHRSDTLFFWENNRLKKGAGTRPLFRQKYFNLGDLYLVAFRLDNSDLKDPQTYPIYQVKIEGTKSGGPIKTTVIHLPLQKAVRICNNGITDDFPLVKPVKTLDGKSFEPLEIVLNQPQPYKLVKPLKDELQFAVRFKYQTESSQGMGMERYLLDGAKIFNTQTGKLHQEIYIPRISTSHQKDSRDIVKFADFYNRGIAEAKDFSVQIETWRDLVNKVSRQKLHYYIFNTTTKTYEPDTALNNYNDVFYDEPSKTMRRYDFLTTARSRMNYTYQLENKIWVLIEKNEVLFEPPPLKVKFPSTNCIHVDQKSHILPVKAAARPNDKRIVADTFWLYNGCEDTLYITKVESSTKDFFRFNRTIPPKQRTPVAFNGVLTADEYDFNIRNFFCALTLTDGSILGLGIQIPTVSNNATVFYRSDSTILYSVGNRPKARFTTSVFTYPNGHLRAMGPVQDQDTSQKVGNWLYFNEGSIGSTDELHSKSISLSAFDGIHQNEHNRFKVRILEDGYWKEPVADFEKNKVRFFVTSKTDCVLAYTDTTRYGFALSYKKLPVFFKKEFYLLKPGERTLKIGPYETPFNVVKNQYALILDYRFCQSKPTTTYKLVTEYIDKLKVLYPDIGIVYISTNQRGIDLERLDIESRKKVLQQLVKDSCLRFISQLYYLHRNPQNLGYCDNRVHAAIDIDTEYPEKFRRTARRLGYSDIETDMGNNRFWLTYPGKIIDEGFFESFDRLTKEEKVMGVFLNTYLEQVPDREKVHE